MKGLVLFSGWVAFAHAAETWVDVPEIHSVDGVLKQTISMEVAEVKFNDILTVNTRLFNGQFPGHTYRIKPGDTIDIDLVNNMPDQPDVDVTFDKFSYPDRTNIHFHGLVVPSERPCDDVLVTIDPTETLNYNCPLFSQHMPGAAWIHPHAHGAAALQVGGGAASAIIVDDPADYFDGHEQLTNARERVWMIQRFSFPDLSYVAKESNDTVFSYNFHKENIQNKDDDTLELYAGTHPGFMPINGVFLPNLEVAAGDWERWRLIFAGWQGAALDMAFEEGSGCEMQLLGKDSIYIKDFPRPINIARVPVGGRGDVMVCCSKPSTRIHIFTRQMEYCDLGGKDQDEADEEGEQPCGMHAYLERNATGFVSPSNSSLLATITVTGSEEKSCGTLDHWYPDWSKHEYLTNLTDQDVTTGCACNTRFGSCNEGDPNHTDTICKKHEIAINGIVLSNHSLDHAGMTFQHTTYNGAITQRAIYGTFIHTWHSHVFPGQIQGDNQSLYKNYNIEVNSNISIAIDEPDNYYQIGDWIDSHHDHRLEIDAAVVIKFAPLDYAGHIAIHCHQLWHEDQGMMAFEHNYLANDTENAHCTCQEYYATEVIENFNNNFNYAANPDSGDTDTCGAYGTMLSMAIMVVVGLAVWM